MKKRGIKICLTGLCLFLLCGCGKQDTSKLPELEQIKNICELSTLKCVYNNVAKGTKKAGEGIKHIGEKDRKYWIEYEGYVKIGIDLSKVQMDILGENVKITLPEAEIQEIGIVDETFTEESIISNEDSFWNKNKITAEDQQKIVADAQEEMKNEVAGNQSILNQATERAKNLIENYIIQLGNSAGISYHIEWS